MRFINLGIIKTVPDTDWVKVAPPESEDIFMVNQTLVLRIPLETKQAAATMKVPILL